MTCYTFRESVGIEETLPNNAMIFFDVLRGTTTHHHDQSDLEESDYDYIIDGEDAGAFAIKVLGPNVIIWTVAQMTGKSQKGDFFQLKYKKNDDWIPCSGASPLRSSSTSGMGMVTVYPKGTDPLPDGGVELDDQGRVLLGLFNISGMSIQINRENYLKSSLIIFASGNVGPDPGEIDRLREQFSGLNRISYNPPLPEIRADMKAAELVDQQQNKKIVGSDEEVGLLGFFEKTKNYFIEMTVPSVPIVLRSPEIPGLGVSIMNTGNIYSFWNLGYVNTLNAVKYQNAQKVFLANTRSGDAVLFEPLTRIPVGERLEALCYVQGSAPYDFFPIYFDAEGVYLEVPANYQFNPKSTYSFCRTIILE